MAFRKVIKQHWGEIWERTWKSVLFCGLTALAAVLAIGFLGMRFLPEVLKGYNQYFMGIAPGVSAVVVAFLVGATIVYARAAKQQAEASLKMAEEMREQRYSESLPLLAPTIPPPLSGLAPNEIPYESLQSGVGIKVIWCNVGKGVAVNSRFSFCAAPISPGKASFFPPRESGTLEVGGKKEVDYSKILNDGQLTAISDAYQPRLEAEYQDIYEREVTTVQKFRIEEQNGNKRAFLGDLYFTVNGKRLGEESNL